MEKVSVIIPTFNRFKFLLNTIKSIKEQTYQNIEIIVVNDCSTEEEYYTYNWKENNILIVHLEENTRKIFGFACAGFVRNKGIEISTGHYVAFCDDDDIWFPLKIEWQLNAMKSTCCKMSTTDGLIGKGIYNDNETYKKFNAEKHFETLKQIYRNRGNNLLENGFPKIWTLDFLRVHNCVICSSVLIEKELLNKINNFRCFANGQEDYDCWLRVLENTNSVYVDDICFYYDDGHGNGQNY
jgi:teichuronic acid biosynthesis glycosyltransferase TuaG